jgi:hypothetical protein
MFTYYLYPHLMSSQALFGYEMDFTKTETLPVFHRMI